MEEFDVACGSLEVASSFQEEDTLALDTHEASLDILVACVQVDIEVVEKLSSFSPSRT